MNDSGGRYQSEEGGGIESGIMWLFLGFLFMGGMMVVELWRALVWLVSLFTDREDW